MVILHDYIRLLRVEQWYKNSVIFIALLFSGNLFSGRLVLLALVAFVSLSFVSSANYIINDLKDISKDRKHPLKKQRPLASNKISTLFAKKVAVSLIFLGFTIAYFLNPFFLLTLLCLFVLMQVYTFYLKKHLYFDIFLIAVFFVLRAVLGAVALLVWISPWLIICPFFLALFLAAIKRYADLKLLGSKSSDTREVLKQYTLKQARRVIIISGILLLSSFGLYAIQNYSFLLFSLPLAAIALYRYWKLVEANPHIGLQTQKAAMDWKLVFVSLVWFLFLVWTLY